MTTHDPHSKRIFRLRAIGAMGYEITPEHITPRAPSLFRQHLIYLDDRIGEILANPRRTTRQEAVIVFVSDHGDMLGRRVACGLR